jgi:hypothetical protein
MRRHLPTRSLLFGIAVAAFVAVAGAAPASAAPTESVDIVSATRVAKGAAVDLATVVVCESGYSAFVFGTVTQRSGNTVAQGYGGTQVACTGAEQTVVLQVLAQSGGGAFKKGTAIASAELQVCTEFECRFVQTSETIKISG